MNPAKQLAPRAGTIARDYSLEITVKDLAALTDAKDVLPKGAPVSITFLPNESWEARIAAAAGVRRIGLTPVPHIAARQLRSEAEFRAFLDALSREAAIDRVFVIAGDTPAPRGPYPDALSLVRSGEFALRGIQTVGIAGYPDGHPKIASDLLHKSLLDKRAALKSAGHRIEIVTQFGFDADPLLDWIRDLRAADVDDLVRIGVPGPASVKSLLRFAGICGVGTSAKVLAKYGLSLGKLMGSAGPDQLITALEAGLDPSVHGRTALHIYPFGGIGRALEHMSKLAAV